MAVDLNLYEDHFHTTLITPNTYLMSSRSPATPWGSDNYLLEGDECAICIDSGMSKLNFYEYAKTYTNLPIHGVINTHSHFDHTGGNGYFPRVYMHPLAEKGAKTPFGADLGGDANQNDFILDYDIIPLNEGDTINLGNRELEIIYIGAHDLSSIAILDKTYRILFSGDELESGWCNVNIEGNVSRKGSTIEDHYHNMLKLKARWDEYDIICPAHHGAPLAKEFLNHVLIADKMIMDGAEGSPDIPAKNGGEHMRRVEGARVFRYKTAHIGYNVNTIFRQK